jgi:hypothetical protein
MSNVVRFATKSFYCKSEVKTSVVCRIREEYFYSMLLLYSNFTSSGIVNFRVHVALCFLFMLDLLVQVGPGSAVGIATGYGLDGPGIESRWGRDFPHRPWGPPSLLYNGYRVFLGGKERLGRDADPSLPSSVVVMKG